MYSSFSDWWNALILFEQIYWAIAIPATLIFLIQLILTFIGGDVDHDHDFDVDTEIESDHGIGFHFISLKNLVAFFTIFGWTGLACIDAFSKEGEAFDAYGVTIFISIICGVIMMLIMAGIYYFMSRLSHSGTLDMRNAIGKVGDVYLTIPAKKEGLGKVQIKVQGGLRTLDAMTTDIENIKTGSIIEVEDIVGENILLVKRSR